MKKVFFAALAALAVVGCSKKGGVTLNTQIDSLSYIIGMNVGLNLQRMDSTLNAEAVCEGIRDVYKGTERLTMEQAKTYYLRYLTYEKQEKVRAYEEKFLEEISLSNRAYARSESGLTYAVEEVGDERRSPSNRRDTVLMRYVLKSSDGKQLYSSYESRDTMRVVVEDMKPGMKESVQLLGKGGKMQVWIPAALAYGAEGDQKLGVKPNATLYYEIELVDVRKN